MESQASARLQIILSMFIFGTIGILVHYIPLPSAAIAAVRGVIGTLFLLLFMLVTKKKLSFLAIKKKLLLLCISGGAIGINWVLLFESYKYTSVSKATLCYYLAPVFVMIASPIFLRERLTAKKTVCIICALFGMVLVSGVLDSGFDGVSELLGIILGVLAAMVYASVIIMNKKLGEIGSYDRTVIQLAAASVVVIPYTLLAEDISVEVFTPLTIVLIIVVGAVHTGLAYTLYFGAIKRLEAQSVAICSYIDPVVAIILSALILNEKMTVLGIIGSIMVLASTFVCEISFSELKRKKNDE